MGEFEFPMSYNPIWVDKKFLKPLHFNGEIMQFKLYHNPRCSKSRQAKTLLEENNIAFETILYLNTPLTEKELEYILNNLSVKPIFLVRTKEKLFKEWYIGIVSIIPTQSACSSYKREYLLHGF